MKNTVTASIHFYFKGKEYTPRIVLDVDSHMQSKACLPNLFPLIAKENDIDLYSYEYEMMQAEEISFTDASGLISDFINNGQLDISGFEAAWHDQHILNCLEEISQRHMGVTSLQEQPDLERALREAYELGMKGRRD